MSVTVESLKKAGHENPEAAFVEIARAGGFGDIEPNHNGSLDVEGIGDPKAKAKALALLSPSATKKGSTANV